MLDRWWTTPLAIIGFFLLAGHVSALAMFGFNCRGGSENPSLTARDEPGVCNFILTNVGASDTTKSA